MDSRFEQLKSVLDFTLNSEERKILLVKMAPLGSFKQLKSVLDFTLSSEEREILLKAMVGGPEQSVKQTKGVKRQKQESGTDLQRKHYDVFIAHASEDKDFVTPLALSLKRRGLQVWYDDFVLKVGDSLRREIDKGLAQSRYGVVILSHNFFNKHWPQKELDGLAAKERLSKKVIIPVWHNIDREEVENYSPTLADIKAAKSNTGVENVVNEIIDAISS